MGPTRSIALTASLALAGLLATTPVPAAKAALAPGDPAPTLVGRLWGSQDIVEIDWSASRYTLVNFWATWCEICKVQMPRLQELQTAKAEEGFQIFGVFDRGATDREIWEYCTQRSVDYPMIEIEGQVNLNWGGIGVLPTLFLVDHRGTIRRRYVGGTPEQTEGIVADVEALLAGRPMPPLVMPRSESMQQMPEDANAIGDPTRSSPR